MYGDIDPYKNGFWNFLLTILSFGLLTGVRFPDGPILFGLIRIPREVLHYKPPPFDDVVRASTQRRETPKGFPGKPPQQGMHSDEKKATIKMNRDRATGSVSADKLNDIWAGTFTRKERFLLFWKAPFVLYLYNIIVAWAVTLFFTVEFVGGSKLEPQSPAMEARFSATEVLMISYHFCALVREVLQVVLEAGVEGSPGFIKYVKDTWNLVDWIAMITFACGLSEKKKAHRGDLVTGMPWLDETFFSKKCPTEEDGDPSGCMYGGAGDTAFHWDFRAGELLYGFSIFFMYLKLLRSFAVIRRLSLIVKIFLSMLRDVLWFLVMYVLFLVAFSMLMIGAGTPDSVVDSCGGMALRRDGGVSLSNEERYEYLSCWQSYWFFRTLFQSFGEFYLDEMTNAWAVIFVITMFFLMNVVLMNLLIAMMSNTYAQTNSQAQLATLLDYYDVTLEYSRYSSALPPPFNVLGLLYQLYLFGRRRSLIRKRWPKAGNFRRLDLFLSRNSSALGSPQPSIRQPDVVRDRGDGDGEVPPSSEHPPSFDRHATSKVEDYEEEDGGAPMLGRVSMFVACLCA